MGRSITKRFSRLGAMLGILLALVFAGASLSSAVDRIQHAPGAPAAHQHLAFSEYSADASDAEHLSPQGNKDGRSDDIPAGHHHHMDAGAGLVIRAPAAIATMSPSSLAYRAAPATGLASPRAAGPEKPPKAAQLLA